MEKTERDKTVGIFGGMGSESTAHFFFKLIKSTPVKKDQDHLHIIIDNNSSVPDRTQAILGNGESPVEEGRKSIRMLEEAGAEIIAIPCNTMHYYHSELQSVTSAPVINMVSETASHISNIYPEIEKVGLLATTGTLKSKLYHEAIQDTEVLTPDDEMQEKVMNAIYGEKGIKAGYTKGNPHDKVMEVVNVLLEEDEAEAIILGCTELSLLPVQNEIDVPVIDPLQVLADVVVKEAKADL
ncbi:aspartate racemase [Methanohalophilus levihalophilus]|uniref:aspartate/glutamate racemase family protein n=1 Tax=Methanohalophilus levihalophilus TaxID=1431282 RepID=UPI001AE71715|nr:amino acid racemase [Methanohalophilus levihalophilus]MBP2029642.1 aspartate racemase [Methanohalophilus levihalophilus]